MRTLAKRLQVARTILDLLNQQPLGRTPLENRTIKKADVTHAVFEGIFQFLRQNGYLEKSSQKHRAPYQITEKGRKLQKGLA